MKKLFSTIALIALIQPSLQGLALSKQKCGWIVALSGFAIYRLSCKHLHTVINPETPPSPIPKKSAFMSFLEKRSVAGGLFMLSAALATAGMIFCERMHPEFYNPPMNNQPSFRL